MAQRFSIVGAELIKMNKDFELITTRSLVSEFNLPTSPNIHVIEDMGNKITMRSWITILMVLIRISASRYKQIHLAGAGRLTQFIVWGTRISSARLSCTFASRTLDMASYGRETDRKKWIDLLNSVDQIDVLNPSHDLHRWKEKISVSPCSFPSKSDRLPKRFENPKRRVAVFCGAFEAYKNPILAIEIIESYITHTKSDVKLVMFGKGTLDSKVERRIEAINTKFGRQVASLEKSDLLGVTLASANVFFSLQEIDNYPSQSVQEAMLMGCKVIATHEGDTALLVPSEGNVNYLVDSRTPEDFLPAMRSAFADLTAATSNVDFINRHHSLKRFLSYFTAFVEDEVHH